MDTSNGLPILPFDSILNEVGGASYYQFLVFVLMSTAKMFPTLMSVLPVFMAYKQPYTCRWPENSTVPVPGEGLLIRGACTVYRNGSEALGLPCSEWDFDTTVFTSTIRSRYNLTCDRAFLAELSTTLFFVGFVIGSAVYGWISDRVGRLVAIVASGTHLSICCAGAGLAPTYWLFAVLRFLGGIANGGLLATCFTMMAEVTDVEHRVIYSLLVHNGFSYGCCLMALIAYCVRDSVWMQIICALTMLSVWIFPLAIPESPRWLYTTGRWRRAEKAVRYVARLNRRRFTEELQEKAFRVEASVLMDEKPSLDVTGTNGVRRGSGEEGAGISKPERPEKPEKPVSVSALVLFRRRLLTLTTLINWYTWFTVSMGFFASIYTLGDIGGNIFLNFVYSSLIELPSRLAALYTSKRWGRVPTLAISLILGSVGCFVNAVLIVFPSVKAGLLVTSVINKFWFTAGFDTIWTYSGEVYPTVIRNMGVGMGSMWARIGGTLAPQTSILFDVWAPLPLIILGILPFLAGSFGFLLPETLDRNMLETVDDMRHLIVHYSRLGKCVKDTEKPPGDQQGSGKGEDESAVLV